jgi:hypothetical protein
MADGADLPPLHERHGWVFLGPHHYLLEAGKPVGAVWDPSREPLPNRYRWQCAGRSGRTATLIEARVLVEWAWREYGDAWESSSSSGAS